jgi:hypothetical protein
MNKTFLVLIGLFLASCATVPATIKIQDNEILRGSARGKCLFRFPPQIVKALSNAMTNEKAISLLMATQNHGQEKGN